jgi:hypothetical protein
MEEIALKSLTLPEKREEADYHLLMLKQDYAEKMRLSKQLQEKADDIIQMLNHLEALYNKKYGSKL